MTPSGPDADEARTFKGTWQGGAGEFGCTQDPCTVTADDAGKLTFSSGWTFTFDDDAKVDVADTDYLQFGYWMQTTVGSDGVAAYDFDAFSGGMTAVTGTRDFDAGGSEVEGSATYKGPAGGMYVRKTLDAEGGVMNAMHGNFTADAELTANFGGDEVSVATQYSVSGTVKKFMDGMTPLSGWSVNLMKSMNFATRTDDPNTLSGATQGMTGDIAGAEGAWNGKFYGGADDDVDTTDADERIPTGIAGEFDAHFSNGHVSGGFGAVKQD